MALSTTNSVWGIAAILIGIGLVWLIHRMVMSHFHEQSPQKMIISMEVVAFATVVGMIVIDEALTAGERIATGSIEHSVSLKIIIVFGSLVGSLGVYIGATEIMRRLKEPRAGRRMSPPSVSEDT